MKQRYRTDHRTLVNEDDSIIGLWEKIMVLGAIYGVSHSWSSLNPVTVVRSWRKLLPDLEEDNLQGFPNEEISRSEILDMVCVMRSIENTNEETLNNGV
jgi:hypothetical protein